MKKSLWILGLSAVTFAGLGPLWADDGSIPPPSDHSLQNQFNYQQPSQAPQRLVRPLFLKPTQILQDADQLEDADVPAGEDGSNLGYDLDNVPPSSQFMKSFTSPKFGGQIQRYNRREKEAGNYWHTYQKRRYSHYTDDQGNHWYGGPSDEVSHKWVMLLWRNGRFWWHDTDNDRWLYYYKNYWWSPNEQDPSLMDVYLNGQYYSCDRTGQIQMRHQDRKEGDDNNQGDERDGRKSWRRDGGGDAHDRDWHNRNDHQDRDGVAAPNLQTSGNNGDARDLGTSQYYDLAKTRLIQVTGANRDAFLYDVTQAHTLDHVYLTSNVVDVQFSNDATGKAWMITLTLQDGTTKGYNADGHLTMP